MGSQNNAPGPSGAVLSGKRAALKVDSTCTPQPLYGQMAFTLACGGTLTAQKAVSGQAQLVSATTGQPANTGTIQNFTLAPGQTVTLATPPSGQEWVVVDFTAGQVALISAEVIGGVVVVTGLAGYGLYRLIADRVAAHKHKRTLKRFSRWFFGQ